MFIVTASTESWDTQNTLIGGLFGVMSPEAAKITIPEKNGSWKFLENTRVRHFESIKRFILASYFSNQVNLHLFNYARAITITQKPKARRRI